MFNEQLTKAVRQKYNRNARFYDLMDRMIQPEWRDLVARQATGRVLEIGVGTGKNLPHYRPEITAAVVGIDLSPGMLERAHAKPCHVPLELREMDAQRMAFGDGTFDTVLATCVFCTVPDPLLGLAEARRVCKPGGRVVLLEHMRIDRPVTGAVMDLLDPLVAWLWGSHINRRTVENVRQAGLMVERVEPVKGDLVKLIVARP